MKAKQHYDSKLQELRASLQKNRAVDATDQEAFAYLLRHLDFFNEYVEQLVRSVEEEDVVSSIFNNAYAHLLMLSESMAPSGSNRNRLGTALHIAVFESNLANVRLLLDSHPDYLNWLDAFEETALHLAAMGNQVDIINELLSKRASTVCQSSFLGNTPLLWAIANCSIEAAICLVQYDEKPHLDLSDTSGHGNTPLILAIAKGWDRVDECHKSTTPVGELIKALIAAGADVNKPDGAGNTPLHMAFLQRDINSIRLLLENGAALDRENNTGECPQYYIQATKRQARTILDRQVCVFTQVNSRWDVAGGQAFHQELGEILKHFNLQQNFSEINTKMQEQCLQAQSQYLIEILAPLIQYANKIQHQGALGRQKHGLITAFNDQIKNMGYIDIPEAFVEFRQNKYSVLEDEQSRLMFAAVILCNVLIAACTVGIANLCKSYSSNWQQAFFDIHKTTSAGLFDQAEQHFSGGLGDLGGSLIELTAF